CFVHLFLFILLGFALGVLGTLVGAGGGFILVPILLLMYPHDQPETITAISLTVIACNAASGSIGYWRHRKIDVRSALWFAITAVPGSVFGVMVAARLPAYTFQLILGTVLVCVSGVLLVRPAAAAESNMHVSSHESRSVWGPQIHHSRPKGLMLAAV